MDGVRGREKIRGGCNLLGRGFTELLKEEADVWAADNKTGKGGER